MCPDIDFFIAKLYDRLVRKPKGKRSKENAGVEVLVSVIIPMYNCGKYIGRCIRSLIDQTYKSIEILVVDDGSTDNGAKIVKKLQQESNCLKYFWQENQGPSIARNKAIEEAEGKYLLFVDSDDYVSDDYIADMVQSAEENHSELVIAGYTLVYADKRKSVEIIPENYKKDIAEEWAYRISSCWGRLYSREFWTSNHIAFHQEKNSRAEDVPIVLYSNIMAKNITIVQNAGYHYFQHPESAMNQLKNKVIFQFPYQAFREMYRKVRAQTGWNSRDYFDIGVIKFLTQFTFLIYRNAESEEKKRLKKYIIELLQEDWKDMVSAWKSYRRNIQFPFVYKAAIELFIFKYQRAMRTSFQQR